jgi:predicted RNA binding protein YcfA (HicA-like mRNA interferase family)
MCRILEQNGWTLVRTKSSHFAYRKPDFPGILIVPVHGNKDLKPGTQHGIRKAAELEEDDL